MLGLDNPIHILMVLVVVLMLFGAKRLPEMGKSLGEGLHGFKRAISGEHTTESLTAAHAMTETEPTYAEAVAAPTVTGTQV
jgi:sec-independent protein translocase protein TatA